MGSTRVEDGGTTEFRWKAGRVPSSHAIDPEVLHRRIQGSSASLYDLLLTKTKRRLEGHLTILEASAIGVYLALDNQIARGNSNHELLGSSQCGLHNPLDGKTHCYKISVDWLRWLREGSVRAIC